MKRRRHAELCRGAAPERCLAAKSRQAKRMTDADLHRVFEARYQKEAALGRDLCDHSDPKSGDNDCVRVATHRHPPRPGKHDAGYWRPLCAKHRCPHCVTLARWENRIALTRAAMSRARQTGAPNTTAAKHPFFHAVLLEMAEKGLVTGRVVGEKTFWSFVDDEEEELMGTRVEECDHSWEWGHGRNAASATCRKCRKWSTALSIEFAARRRAEAAERALAEERARVERLEKVARAALVILPLVEQEDHGDTELGKALRWAGYECG